MHLSTHQRIRVLRRLPVARFDELPGEPPETVVSARGVAVAVWNDGGEAVVGLALTSFRGLPFVAFSDVSEEVRREIGKALAVEVLVLQGLRRQGTA